ncbi:MAG: homoserine O-acetyltransferase [Crocinitomicaceae bacterium]|nr:homoserine O-acetyltransferase [Crocinitomicaceae bacterium]
MYSEITRKSFVLENGATIKDLTIGYHTYGSLNAKKSNVIWVCHALTANANVLEWWDGLFGNNQLFDPDKYFIVCANVLGSCYGTTGPGSESEDGPLLDYFPDLTTRDMARAHEELRQELGLSNVYTLIGASLGGQQALEWSIAKPEVFQNLILIATNARHSAYGIAFNESQRMAICNDRSYGKGSVDDAKEGLAIARSIAMLSYRSYEGYVATQTDDSNSKKSAFKAGSYQKYQGNKLADRFNAYAYVTLSKAMDSHNVGRNRESISRALNTIKARTIVIGISSDNLFPTAEQKLLATHIPIADYFEIDSQFGHDGFLIETNKLEDILNDFLLEDYIKIRPTVFKTTTTKKNQLMNLVANV